MKTELEMRRELKSVRSLLAENRRNGIDIDILYGAQQALAWIIEEARSPSELESVIRQIAEEVWAPRGSRGEGRDEERFT